MDLAPLPGNCTLGSHEVSRFVRDLHLLFDSAKPPHQGLGSASEVGPRAQLQTLAFVHCTVLKYIRATEAFRHLLEY